MNDIGHWVLSEGLDMSSDLIEEPKGDFMGFVYSITNLVDDRIYIGQKTAWRKKKYPPLKGKNRNRWLMKPTDWKKYSGSSNELLADIEMLGKDNFKFEILKYCYSRSELSYYEAKIQMDEDVLLSDKYYNGIINIRLSKIKFQDEE